MAERIKILYVITKSNWGGAQKYVYDLATSLPKESYEAVVVFGGSGPLAEKLTEAGIRTISIKHLARDVSIVGDCMSFCSLISLFLKEKPRIVHLNSSKIGGLGAVAGRLTGIRKILFTCHGWAFNEDRSLPSLFIIRFISWITVLFSHAVIAVSHRDFRDGEKMIGAKGKMIMVHNGIRLPDFLPKAEARVHIQTFAQQKEVEIKETDFIIGAIGELHKNKGYEYLIKAFSLARENAEDTMRLVIMGEGEERKKLENLIAELGLSRHVLLAGFVKNASIYLKSFDIATLSSIKEGLPYVLIEAGFAELPVIASHVGGVKEIVDDMRSGILVQPRKPEDTAKAILLLKADTEKATSFAHALKQHVETEFSLALMVQKTEAIYLS